MSSPGGVAAIQKMEIDAAVRSERQRIIEKLRGMKKKTPRPLKADQDIASFYWWNQAIDQAIMEIEK